MYSSLLSLQIQTWLEKKSSTINKLYLYLTNMIFEEFVKKDRIFLPFFFKLSIETTLQLISKRVHVQREELSFEKFTNLKNRDTFPPPNCSK